MLELRGLTKVFTARTGSVRAVDDVSLTVERGELVSLLGPSGCGKTTMLRLIAGFENATSGEIRLAGRDVSRLPPQRRETGMVFQNYALFPHLDVFENVAFGLRTRGDSRADVERRVNRSLELVDLAGYGPRRVQELSGGQQQRVALARALAPEPPLLLLDEPLSNLDAALRERTRAELRSLLKQLGMTAVFVTHDQDEAFALADRIALLSLGRLQQFGTPAELYGRPANPFVAGFIGSANFLRATIRRDSRAGRAGAGGGDTLTAEVAAGVAWPAVAAPGLEPADGDVVRIMVRPEALEIRDAGTARAGGATGAAVPGLPAVVRDSRFAGAFTAVRMDADGAELVAHVRDTTAADGQRIEVAPVTPVLAFPTDT
jgi:iron(III) transport system ATP-binding protein